MGSSVGVRSGQRGVRALYESYHRVVVGVASVIVVLLLWQMVGVISPFAVRYVSGPAASVAAGWKMMGEVSFWRDVAISAEEVGLGFMLGLVAGLFIGVNMAVSKRIGYLIEPVIMAINTTPRLALIPVLLIWLGIGIYSKVAIVFLGVVVPVALNTMLGIRGVDPVLLRAGRSFGARRRDVYWKIMFPASAPAVMMGARLGLGRAIVGMLVAEMYVSVAGLGHALVLYGQAFRIDALMFLVILISVGGFGLIDAVGRLERWLFPWKWS